MVRIIVLCYLIMIFGFVAGAGDEAGAVAGAFNERAVAAARYLTMRDVTTGVTPQLGRNTAETAEYALFCVNNLWIMLGAALVFIMHLGFALLETGLTRAKNCVNVLCKNTLTPAIGLLTFTLLGFGLMYPGNAWQLGKLIGFSGFGLLCPPAEAGLIAYRSGAYTYWTDFLFQGMFAATCVTIVSGAVAGRIKLSGYFIFAVIYSALVYPIVGSWGWGGGWMADLNFHDLAGSTFVHSVGGWAALAGVMILGPRTGKFVNGVSRPIPAHNMPLAVTGTFLLWFGWFGFNGASAFSADPYSVSYILVTTCLAACAGLVTATLTSCACQGKPDLSMILNGCLAGLVAITAGADCVSITSAILIGAVAGVIVVLAVFVFDRLRLDDPVGALSVHLVNGVWGTLAVGVFSPDFALVPQLLGAVAVGAVCFSASALIFGALRFFRLLRVSQDEELRGLDLGEHGMEAYGGFQIFTNQ